jgi:hypothetical protein
MCGVLVIVRPHAKASKPLSGRRPCDRDRAATAAAMPIAQMTRPLRDNGSTFVHLTNRHGRETCRQRSQEERLRRISDRHVSATAPRTGPAAHSVAALVAGVREAAC